MSSSSSSPNLSAEIRLKEAMTRLLSGKANNSDGALTKKNLYLEAGVSRATMNRAKSILAEWDRAVGIRVGVGPQSEAPKLELNSDLRAALKAALREATAAKDELRAAEMMIAMLHNDNRALRDRVHSRTTARVSALSSRRQDASDVTFPATI